MAEFSENRVVNNSEGFLIAYAIGEGRRRRPNMQMALNHLVARRVLNACFLCLYFIATKQHHCSFSLLSVNHTGWLENAWNNYSEAKFKKAFRISRSSFRYLLNRIALFLARETVKEDPLSPELRLALCLYR